MPDRISLTKAVKAVVESAQEQINAGGFRAGETIPSEMELCQLFGASRGTVRKAIDWLCTEGVLVRRPYSRPVVVVRHAPARDASEIFVWICKLISDESSLRLLKGISKALLGTRFRMVVQEPSRFVGPVVAADERLFLEKLLASPNAAGAIIERDPFSNNQDLIERIQRKGKLLVFVDNCPSDVACDFVGTSNRAAARLVTELLIEHGHHRIAFLGDDDEVAAVRERLEGYEMAMRYAGLSDELCVQIASKIGNRPIKDFPLAGPYSAEKGKHGYLHSIAQKLVDEVLQMPKRPTALFVVYDVLAYWVWAVLEGRGYRVPEDFSIHGFDWFAQNNRLCPDVLSTVNQDFEMMGWHAANLLLDRVESRGMAGTRQILLHPPLVKRGSVAHPASLAPLIEEV